MGGMRREELELAHTSRVTIPRPYGVLQAPLSCQAPASLLFCLCPVNWSSSSKLGSHARMLLKARGKQLGIAALRRVGGDAHRVIPCREGKWELLSVSLSPSLQSRGTLRQGLSLPLSTVLSPCTAALPAPASSLLSSAVSGSSRQAIKQAGKGSSQAARMSEEILEREARGWSSGDGRLAVDLLWIWRVVNYAPPAPPGPKAIRGGVCALVQEGRAGQLVPEIRPRHSGTGPPF